LSGLNVQACTDVTGFGLLGHLYELCQASDCAATLDLNAIPVLAGGEALAVQNIKSSLYNQNRQALNVIEWEDAMMQNPRFKLLFDPQTSGGLLAGIPATCYTELDESFHQQFYTIGEVTEFNSAVSQIKIQRAAI